MKQSRALSVFARSASNEAISCPLRLCEEYQRRSNLGGGGWNREIATPSAPIYERKGKNHQ